MPGRLLVTLCAALATAGGAAAQLRITTTSLPQATTGVAYSAPLAATGGKRPYVFSIAGALPSGLNLASATGTISGTPTQAGTVSFLAQVTDANLASASQILSITVVSPPAPITVTTSSLPGAVMGRAYSQPLAASGGTGTYTWSVTMGSLPGGLSLSAAGTIGGTPNATGTFNFTVRASDSTGNGTRALSIAVAPALSITTAALPAGTVGAPYSQPLAASGGTGTYTWSIAGGSLPAGLSIAGSTIAGTPTTAGTSNFTVQVSDGGGTASKPLSIVVNAAPLSIVTESLPAGTVGSPYSQTLAASGGTGAYSWTISGSLPAGLTLSGNTIAGTPTTAGTSTFTVQVSAGTATASKQLSITINPAPLQVTTASLPAGTAGTPYSQILAASGGTGTYTWTIAGSLPAGLTLTGATIAGTPTTAGASTFTVQVSDGATVASKQLSIAVNPAALQIATASLPPGTVGTPYSQALAATGGAGSYTWSISGNLPAGLALSGATIGGTPTTAGTSTFTVQVSAGAATASKQLSITVNPPALQVATASLPAGTVGTPYSQGLTATGGTGTYAWTMSGSLPAGLALSGATIGGTPTTAGTSTFTVQVNDGATTASRQLSIAIAPPNLQVATASLATALAGSAYSQTLAATGGTPPYAWSIGGNLPAGLALSGATIAGTPIAPGIVTFAVRVSDAAGNNATRTLSIAVAAAPLAIVTTTLPPAVAGLPYAQAITVSGGTPPYTFAVNGSLPPGMTIAAGILTGTPTAPGAFSFALQVSDATPQNVSRVLTLTVAAPLQVFTASLADAVVGTVYVQTLAATGGTPPYRWAVTSGALPDGIALDPGNGQLAGTPRSPGTFTFSIQVTDSAGVQAARSYSMAAAAGLTITTAPVLPSATAGAVYRQSLSATGGNAPYTWTVSAGALPAGLSLDPSGALSGTPANAGQFQFTVQAADSTSARTAKQLSLTVTPALLISSAPSLPDGFPGTAYTQPLSAAGGTPPYTWSISAGALPAGLQIDPTTGVIGGTPTAAGTFNFTAQVSDNMSVTATKQFSLRIVSGLAITGATLPNAVAGSPYSQALAAAGGAPPYRWSVTAGALPAGLLLDPASGAIAGTPASGGTFTFTAGVSDAAGLAATRDFTLTVDPASLASVSINGGADVLTPLQQPAIGVALGAPYPSQITGQLTLTFQPDAVVPSDDPSVQFATGGRTASFTIPANSTAANFSIPSMLFQTGSVAGTITIALSLSAGGADITPPSGATRTMRVSRTAPAIRSASIVQTSSGFEIHITGLSPDRELTSAAVTLSPAAGSSLQTTQLTVPLSSAAGAWYQNGASTAFGSQFTLVLPFSVQGSVQSIGSAAVTLTNQVGTSQAATARF